jgi:choice-of-anchor B domain-containing protein
MITTTRMRLSVTIAATLAALALLAPTLAVADEGGSTSDATSTSEGGLLQLLQDRLDTWSQLLEERVADDASSGVDGKAGDLSDVAVDSSVTPISDIPCEDGRAFIYPCDNVDLLSLVPNAMLGGGNGNDIWGWTDPETGGEYAIMGTGYGTAFIDVTEPTDPVVLAKVPTESGTYIPLWRDIKVFDDHAFIVSEHDFHGMQVVDLTQLRDLSGPFPQPVMPDAVYSEFGNAHNIAINEDTGYAYAVGSDTCAGGLHMIDINDPTEPEFAGCFDEDGYTHDVQCVVYEGPAGDLQGRELCFASNEDTVTIVDVTDKDDPVQLSRTGYDEAAYTHQGWLTPDQDWFLFGDELDEQRGTVDNTTTYIMDVSDPANPGDPVPYFHETNAIDHNLYLDDDYVWQANYVAGLRVLDYDDDLLAAGQLDEVAYFEVVPDADPSEFAGAWSSYPYFESGTVVVSTLEQGLFVLRPTVERPSLDGGDGGDDPSDPDDGRPGNGKGGPPEDRPGNGGRPDDGGGQGPPDGRPAKGGAPTSGVTTA